MSWPGQHALIRSRIRISDLRSATVTRSASPLYSTFTCCWKYPISKAPASRAISDMTGIKSLELVMTRRFTFSFASFAEFLWTQRRSAVLLALSAVFRDVHDLVFEDKQIGLVFAGHSDHILVVVFDPAADDFAVRQLDAYGLLFFSERLQVCRLLRGLLGGGGPSLAGSAGSLSVKRHRSYFTRPPRPQLAANQSLLLERKPYSELDLARGT